MTERGASARDRVMPGWRAVGRVAGPLGAGLAVDVAVISAATLGSLGLGALTLRRRTP